MSLLLQDRPLQHRSHQGKPETSEPGEISCNWLVLPKGTRQQLSSHLTKA